MYVLARLTCLATLIPIVMSIGCSQFQLISKRSPVSANASASTYGSHFDPIPVSDTVQCNSSNVAGSYCDSSHCLLKSQPDVIVTVPRQLNLTITDIDVADSIFALLKDDFDNAENVNTNSTWTYSTGGGFSSGCISEGTTAYWGYLPGMSCVTGTLSACDSSSGIENGTAIYACGVLTRNNTLDVEVPTLGYGYVQTYEEPAGTPGMALTNGTLPSSSGAIGRTDMVVGKTLRVSILIGIVAVALAL